MLNEIFITIITIVGTVYILKRKGAKQMSARKIDKQGTEQAMESLNSLPDRGSLSIVPNDGNGSESGLIINAELLEPDTELDQLQAYLKLASEEIELGLLISQHNLTQADQQLATAQNVHQTVAQLSQSKKSIEVNESKMKAKLKLADLLKQQSNKLTEGLKPSKD